MLEAILSIFIHVHNWSFPITPRKKALRTNANNRPSQRHIPDGFDSYQTCLDCGEERLFSWERMSASKPRKKDLDQASRAAEAIG